MGTTGRLYLYSFRVFRVIALILGFCTLTALDAHAQAAYFESDGLLRDLVTSDGDTIDIDTGATPPTFAVDAFPIGAVYKGRVIDGAAVFSFEDISIGEGTTVTVTGTRPLVINGTGDVVIGASFDCSAGICGGGQGGAGSAGASGGNGGIGGAGGAGGAGGKGGKGANGNAESLPGEAGLGSSGGSPGNPGNAGNAGNSNSQAGGAGGSGFGNSSEVAGQGGAGGSNEGEDGQPGTGSSLVGGAGEGVLTGGDGGTVLTLNITTPPITYGLPGSGGTAGGAGTAPADSNATPGKGGAAGNDGTNGVFGIPADTFDLAAGPGGGGGGGGAGGGGGGSGGGGGGGGGGSGGGGGASTNIDATLPIVNLPVQAEIGGGGGGGGSGGRGGQGGTGGSGGGSGGNGGSEGGLGQPGTDGTSGQGGTGGDGTGGVLGFGATGGSAGDAGAGGTGGAGGAGGSGGIGGAGGTGGNGGGAILIAARGLLHLLPGVEINISASLPQSSGAGSAGGAGASGSAGSAGAPGGAGGAPGEAPLLPVQISYANGGTGGTGGNSGGGALGAGGGNGGAGGAGGYGVPGMLKVQGSVVLASGAQLKADNAAGAGADENGRYTVVSNMSAGGALLSKPALSTQNLVRGQLSNDDLLLAANPYLGGASSPILPQLDGDDVAASGYCKAGFWNKAEISTIVDFEPAGLPVVYVRLFADNDGLYSGAESVFDGYDQIFFVNRSAQPVYGKVSIVINEGAPALIEGTGNLLAGQYWTTTVPTGSLVSLDLGDLVPEGEPEGQVDGEGVVEGSVEGSTEGAVEGSTEGTTEGVVEGVLEGEGAVDGEGQVEGVIEGGFDGEGIAEGGTEGEGGGEGAAEYSADTDGSGSLSLAELLRVIQLFNAGAYYCALNAVAGEDGFTLTDEGLTFGEGECTYHSGDYREPFGLLQLTELLRTIQFFNLGGIIACPGETEDGFCIPAPAK